MEQYFKLPDLAHVPVTILNGGTILSTANADVEPSKRPNSRNLRRIYRISMSLDAIAIARSLLTLFWWLVERGRHAGDDVRA